MSKSTKQKADLSDSQIIDLYWQRQENAISETDRKYGQFLFRIAYNILQDKMDCEECQNDTYLKVWNAIPPARPVVFPAFLVQIMRRVAINRYRERSRKRQVPSELTVALEDVRDVLCSNETVGVQLDAVEFGRIINDYVKAMPERQRYVFIERFYFAESVESIAADLSVSPATIYREIDKIKQDLKLHLERNDINI